MVALLALALTAAAQEPDYAAECDGGDASSCVLLSILAKKSDDADERAKADSWFRKGVGLLDKACGAGRVDACTQLGEVWLVHGSADEARAAWERGCALDAFRCVDLADDLANRKRTPEGLPLALLERACAQDEGLGCLGAAILGEDAGRSSKDVNGWAVRGLTLLGERCDGGKDPARKAQACSALGDVHYFGIHAPADRDKGLGYWARGCLTGSACRTQAALILAQGDQEGSIALLRRACELGDCTHWYETCSAVESEHCKPLAGAAPKPE